MKKQAKINPHNLYSITEVAEMKIAPYANSYTTVYRLVTEQDLKGKRHLCKRTTKKGIKSQHQGKPWGKISGKIYIEGGELLRFMKYNKII